MICQSRATILIALAVASSLPAQPHPATLEGSVLNSITGQPLRDAEVSLLREGGAEQLLSTTTSTNGAFQLNGVQPGRYVLMASRSGFEPRNYAASEKNAGHGTVLNVSDGAAIKALTIRLNPMGAISGRVIDENGEPMAHVSVEAMRSTWIRGRKQLVAAGQAATDDLGEYRIFGLASGNYLIHAQAQVGGQPVAGRSFSYIPAYYPDAPRAESATPLPLAAGQLHRGIDFVLRKVRTFSVQGHIAGAGNGAMVYLAPKAADGTVDLREKRPVGVRGGYFEIQSVIPGSYLLAADQFGDAPASARLELEINQENIRGLEFEMVRTPPIAGRVTIEGPDVKTADPAAMRIALESLQDGATIVGAEPDPAGRFLLQGVVPGHYRITASNIPAGLYIKAIRAGDTDITRTGLDYSRGVFAAELAVILSPQGGALKGAAKNESGIAAPGVRVVAIPTEAGRQPAHAISDQAGHFEMRDLAPGEYRVLAFENLEPGAAEDTEFIIRVASFAGPVTIAERANATADPVVIPAEVTSQSH
jgi:hypothetical protein